MKNKLCILIICIFVFVSSFQAVCATEISLPVEIERESSFSLDCPIDDLSVGDTVYIRIECSDVDDIYGFEFCVDFNSSYLTYSGSECGIDGEYAAAESTKTGEVRVAFCKKEERSELNATMATLEFTAKRSGTSSISLSEAILISSDMEYSTDETPGETVSVTVKSSGSSGGGSSGGGSGGSGGGYSFSTSGGSNSVSAVSPTLNPVDISSQTSETLIFTDIDEAAWAVSAIERLYELGVVNGYDDGSFVPLGNVTRAEFSKMIAAALGLSVESTDTEYSDVSSGDWYASSIAAVSAYEIVNGYEDGTFMPNSYITREEAAAVICRSAEALNATLDYTRLNINFADEADISEYAVGYIDKLYQAKIISGDDDGLFRPLDNLSRAEAAQMICSLLDALYPSNDEDVVTEETVLGELIEYALFNEVETDIEVETDSGFDIVEDLGVNTSDDEIDETDELEATENPAPTSDPVETIEPESTEEPEPTSEADNDTSFEPSTIFDCESLSEVYAYSNVYAYLVPDDGSRDAFYDDFTTFQRQSLGDAYIVFDVPYCEAAEVVSYFYTGETLVDFEFEVSTDNKAWTSVDFECTYTEQDGKWTEAKYNVSDLDGVRFLKIVFPETVNYWTPLISRVSVLAGESEARGIEITGESEVIVPRYDYTDYKYTARVVDQIGETVEGDVYFIVSESDIDDLSISSEGVVRIMSGYSGGGSFVLCAKNDEYDLSEDFTVTLVEALIGDLNGDGVVDDDDVDISVGYFRVDSSLSDWTSIRNADVNEDGIVNIIDISYIARKSELGSK